MFSGRTVLPGSKETKLRSSDTKRLLASSAGKNIDVVLILCCTWKCVLKVVSSGVGVEITLSYQT